MKVETNTDLKKLEVSVRMDKELAEKGKSHPERQFVKYLRRALDRLDIRYAIKWDFQPVELPRIEDGATKKEQLDVWTNALNGEGDWSESIKGVCKDSNLVLTDRDGGGMSYPKMKGALAPGAVYEAHDHRRVENGESELRKTVNPDEDEHTWFGALHEFAHNISEHGGSHKQSAGKVWHDENQKIWYRTPTGTPGAINLCGHENAPAKPEWEKQDCLYLADCMRKHLLIR